MNDELDTVREQVHDVIDALPEPDLYAFHRVLSSHAMLAGLEVQPLSTLRVVGLEPVA